MPPALCLLADENVPRRLIIALRAASHDMLWIRDQHRSMPDEQVLALGLHEGRILITGDKDVGDLVFMRRQPARHGVILVRAPEAGPEALARIVAEALARETEWGDFFSVIEDGRVRRTEFPQP